VIEVLRPCVIGLDIELLVVGRLHVVVVLVLDHLILVQLGLDNALGRDAVDRLVALMQVLAKVCSQVLAGVQLAKCVRI